ncbi:MAG TPA: OmpA family protein [Polyangiaceae bacterium]|nr:OmpA family protein [Polyangiaceae bacterium]
MPSRGARARGTLSRLRRASALGLSALAACWQLLPAVARAQSGPRAPASLNGDGADTHLFRPAVDSKGFFSVNGTRILPANGISFGLVLDYGRSILRVPDDRKHPPEGVDCTADPNCIGDKALVPNSFQGTFGFNYGIANRAVVGLSLPVVLASGGAVYNIGPAPGALYDSAALNSQGLSWVALHAKLRLTRIEETLGLGVLLQGGIPIGARAHNLVSEPGVWLWPQILTDYQFGSTGRFKVGLNAGFRWHGGDNSSFLGDQLKEGAFRYGNLVTGQFGFSWRALDALDLVGETYGTYLLDDVSDSKQKFSQEYVGGIKLFIERNSYLMMGAGHRIYSTGFEAANTRLLLGFVFEPSIGDRDGDGYSDDVDQCPDDPEDFDGFEDEDGCPDPDNDKDGILDVDDACPDIPEDFDGDQDEDGCPEGSDGDRDGDGILDSRDKCPDVPEDKDGFEDEDGCPDPDNDKDGIPDIRDKCPNDPEDKDGFEDEDGCPEPDNDLDGILDVKDQCPNEPETYNGFEDEDGCPDKGKVVIEGDDILILEKINFATGSAEILPSSFSILDAVATTLKHHPDFLVIEIAGHADERSSDEYNLKLTKDRAASVLQALVDRHVESSRFVSQGYGEYCPISEGHDEAAWEQNRRVEFKVVKTEDGLTGVKRGCARATEKGVSPPVVK